MQVKPVSAYVAQQIITLESIRYHLGLYLLVLLHRAFIFPFITVRLRRVVNDRLFQRAD